MFVIVLEYAKPLEEVDRWIEEHREFLRENYAQGRFMASGPCVPRTGGVILARGCSRDELDALLERDPFKREGVAAYTVVEFDAVMTDPAFAHFAK